MFDDDIESSHASGYSWFHQVEERGAGRSLSNGVLGSDAVVMATKVRERSDVLVNCRERRSKRAATRCATTHADACSGF
jgi:hypothetical protein